MAVTLISEVIHSSFRLVHYYYCDNINDIERLQRVLQPLDSFIEMSQFVENNGYGAVSVFVMAESDGIMLKLAFG